MEKILIVSGEPSGDLHASNLVKDLKAVAPDLRFFGLGGRLSREAGVDCVFDISRLALVGLVEVLKNIFTVGKAYRMILKRIDIERPDIAILIDYPGFNLRLAKELKKRSIRVVYYISPQVWAWGRERIGIIKACVDKMIVFFKFEEELYKTYGVTCEFVGHPLLDTVKPSRRKEETIKTYHLSPDKITIALLPGSRSIEVRTLLPVMVKAARIIDDHISGTQFVIAKYPELPEAFYEDISKKTGLDIKVISGDIHNLLAASDFAIVASGTATLETAIIGTPLVIIYKANLLTYMVFKFVATVSCLGIVNIIAGRKIVPELLQYAATPDKIAEVVISILSDPKESALMRENLSNVKASLGIAGARYRAAQAVAKLLK